MIDSLRGINSLETLDTTVNQLQEFDKHLMTDLAQHKKHPLHPKNIGGEKS